VSQFVRGGHLLPGRGRQRAQVVGVDVDPTANSVGRDGDVPGVVGDLVAEQVRKVRRASNAHCLVDVDGEKND